MEQKSQVAPAMALVVKADDFLASRFSVVCECESELYPNANLRYTYTRRQNLLIPFMKMAGYVSFGHLTQPNFKF